MAREPELVNSSMQIVEHLHRLNFILSLDVNFDIIMKYALLSLRRVDPSKSKLQKDGSVYELTDWTVQLVRMSLIVGREVNRMRKSMGLLPIDFAKEATKEELKHAKDSTIPKEDSSAKS